MDEEQKLNDSKDMHNPIYDSKQLTNAPLSSDPDENPLLSQFTKVFVRYCDGGYFSGNVSSPVPAANGTLLFYPDGTITIDVEASMDEWPIIPDLVEFRNVSVYVAVAPFKLSRTWLPSFVVSSQRKSFVGSTASPCSPK